MAALVGAVSVARCAELLTAAGDKIDRSALSRYCDAHSLKLGKQGREVMVDFETVQKHRADNYTRSVMAGDLAAPPITVAPPPASLLELAAGAERPAVVSRDEGPVPLDAHRRLKEVQLRRELRDEAIEEGQLADVSEIDAGAAEAIVEMRASFAEARGEFAERLAADLGVPPERVRFIRAALKRYDRIGQERFATRLGKALAEANETAEEGLGRLMALAAYAVRLRADRKASR